MHEHSANKLAILLLLACDAASCRSQSASEVSETSNELQPAAPSAPSTAAPAPAPAADAAPPAAPPVAPPVDKPSPDAVGYPREGWSKVRLTDEVPLCVFSDLAEQYKTEFMSQAKPQKLRAGAAVVFGAYAPGCVSAACDDLPSLQCWVDREGDTLSVHSRYIGYHKDGTTCTDKCRPVAAGCPTPPLEAGRYKVKYGEKMFEVRVPSAVRLPCQILR